MLGMEQTAQKTPELFELMEKLAPEQRKELDAYMERIKGEYLQKILDQVNIQNSEYFENLACEYTLQLQQISEGSEVHFSEHLNFGKDTESGEITSQEQASYLMFMRKPEVIKMHLDILYKSINFLNKHKIEVVLQEYKHQKIQKQKEEEERMKM